jgi:hypothetical protein
MKSYSYCSPYDSIFKFIESYVELTAKSSQRTSDFYPLTTISILVFNVSK